VNKDVPNNHTAFGNPMQIVRNKKNNITIAKIDTEETFLKKYPQYKELIKII
jgi:serine acetyltransferase